MHLMNIMASYSKSVSFLVLSYGLALMLDGKIIL